MEAEVNRPHRDLLNHRQRQLRCKSIRGATVYSMMGTLKGERQTVQFQRSVWGITGFQGVCVINSTSYDLV